MSITTQQLPKAMPYSCNKGELYAMYLNQMSMETIRSQINTIIEDNRKTFAANAKFAKRIFHTELVEFVETHGLPNNYYKPENW